VARHSQNSLARQASESIGLADGEVLGRETRPGGRRHLGRAEPAVTGRRAHWRSRLRPRSAAQAPDCQQILRRLLRTPKKKRGGGAGGGGRFSFLDVPETEIYEARLAMPSRVNGSGASDWSHQRQLFGIAVRPQYAGFQQLHTWNSITNRTAPVKPAIATLLDTLRCKVSTTGDELRWQKSGELENGLKCPD